MEMGAGVEDRRPWKDVNYCKHHPEGHGGPSLYWGHWSAVGQKILQGDG